MHVNPSHGDPKTCSLYITIDEDAIPFPRISNTRIKMIGIDIVLEKHRGMVTRQKNYRLNGDPNSMIRRFRGKAGSDGVPRAVQAAVRCL